MSSVTASVVTWLDVVPIEGTGGGTRVAEIRESKSWNNGGTVAARSLDGDGEDSEQGKRGENHEDSRNFGS